MAAVRVLACGACVSLSHAPARPLLSPQQAGGVLYVFGGSDREGTHSSALYAFDLATGSWKGEVAATGVTPPAVGGASLVAAGADLILFGGMNVADGIIIGIIHVFNTVTAVWSKPASVGDRPTPRNGHTLVNVSGRLFLFGGSSPDDGPMNDFFELILPAEAGAAFTWRQLGTKGPAPLPREMHACFGLTLQRPEAAPASFLCLYGGRGFDKVLADICVLDLDTLVWSPPVATGMPRCACAFADSCVPPVAPVPSDSDAAAPAPSAACTVVYGGWDGAITIHDSAVLFTFTPGPDGGSGPGTWEARQVRIEPAVANRFACAGYRDPDTSSLYVYGGMNAERDFSDLLVLSLDKK